MMAQGLFNKTASLFKSSIAEGTLLGWLRLARFARSGKELSSSPPTAYQTQAPSKI
jgi:hypothetical protein